MTTKSLIEDILFDKLEIDVSSDSIRSAAEAICKLIDDDGKEWVYLRAKENMAYLNAIKPLDSRDYMPPSVPNDERREAREDDSEENAGSIIS